MNDIRDSISFVIPRFAIAHLRMRHLGRRPMTKVENAGVTPSPHPEEPRSGVSKDGGNTVLFVILRDAAKRPLLRMRSPRALMKISVICLTA
jgi:hypothetical protein